MTEICGAVSEIVERHDGPKMPETGSGSILVPNVLRINGVGVWANETNPVIIESIRFGHAEAVVVTVTLFARVVRFGSADAPAVPVGGDTRASVIEIEGIPRGLDVGHRISGTVLLNGHRLLCPEDGEPEIVGLRLGTEMAQVRLKLVARRVIVDDEPTGRPQAGALPAAEPIAA